MNPSTIFSRLARAAAISAAVLPAACSYVPGMDRIAGEEGVFRDRQGDYLEAETIPRTRIPDRYDSYIIDDLYVIPEIVSSEGDAYLDAPRPRPLQGRSEREVVIQRIDDRSWVVVDASPSQVWPRVRDYWTNRSVDLTVENPTQGVMETAWFSLEGNSLTKEKFRITIEPGFQDESTEIKLLHAEMPQAVPSIEQIQWPERSQDQELAFETLSDMSSYLADVADLYQASTVSFLAGNIPSKGKASLVSTPAGMDLLRLEADFQRSWAAVGRALDRAGVEVLEQDQESGVYEVHYVVSPETEEKGFFGRLLSLDNFRRDQQPASFNMRVQLLRSGADVEVLVENLGPGAPLPEEGEEALDPENSLLQRIMNFIA